MEISLWSRDCCGEHAAGSGFTQHHQISCRGLHPRSQPHPFASEKLSRSSCRCGGGGGRCLVTVTGWRGCFVPGGRAELPAFCPSQSGSEEPFCAEGCKSLPCLPQEVSAQVFSRSQGTSLGFSGNREAPAGGDCCSPPDHRLCVASIQALFVRRWFSS